MRPVFEEPLSLAWLLCADAVPILSSSLSADAEYEDGNKDDGGFAGALSEVCRGRNQTLPTAVAVVAGLECAAVGVKAACTGCPSMT